MLDDQPITVVINGLSQSLGLESSHPLVRAVVISLFTWRRARDDDRLPGDQRMGWWGDSYAALQNDQIGSRLWLLSREKLLPDVPKRAKEYAEEALAWLVEDKVASRVEVEAERQGIDTLALACRIYKPDGSLAADIRFANVWTIINGI